MPKILVFSPPNSGLYTQNEVSLELGSISGLLEREGYDFRQESLYLECNLRNKFRLKSSPLDLSPFTKDNIINYLRGCKQSDFCRSLREMSRMISLNSYDIVIAATYGTPNSSRGFTNTLMALPILKQCSKDTTTIIAGKIDLQDIDLELVRYLFLDYVIEGDYERPLKNILEHELENEKLEINPGVRYEVDGEIRAGETYIHPLEDKPRPYFDPDLLRKYSKLSLMNYPIFGYKLGEGNSEETCFSSSKEQKFSYKSIEKVKNDLIQLKNETGSEYVRFWDWNISENPGYLTELSDFLADEELDLYWGGRSEIVDRDQAYFENLRRGGCRALHLGIGSMSSSIRQQKGLKSTAKVKQTVRKIYGADINPFAYFRTGYIDEDWSEYSQTLNFCRKNRHLMGGSVRPLQVLPTRRQKIYQNPGKYGVKLEEKDIEPLERAFDFSVSFRRIDSEKSAEQRSRILELKQSHLQNICDLNLFFRNYGRNQPSPLLRKIGRKVYTKDYLDISYAFVP